LDLKTQPVDFYCGSSPSVESPEPESDDAQSKQIMDFLKSQGRLRKDSLIIPDNRNGDSLFKIIFDKQPDN
jgi:hypothetical protein